MAGGVIPPPWLVEAWQTDAYLHGIRADWSLTIMTSVLMTLAVVIVLGRLYDRVLVRHTSGVDDILITIATVFTIGVAICICLADRVYGFDRHAWDLTPGFAVSSRKIILPLSLLFVLGTGFTKISILCFYQRIGEIRQWFKWTIWLNIAFIVLYSTTFCVAVLTECQPMEGYWNKVNPTWAASNSWHCVNEGGQIMAAGIISAIQDIMACILPMVLFWDLKITRRAKVALAFVFSLGIVTCVAAVIRVVYVHRVFFETYDVTWETRPLLTWTTIEACLGLICASMPALKNRLFSIFLWVTSLFISHEHVKPTSYLFCRGAGFWARSVQPAGGNSDQSTLWLGVMRLSGKEATMFFCPTKAERLDDIESQIPSTDGNRDTEHPPRTHMSKVSKAPTR